jgi:hypothetical protein
LISAVYRLQAPSNRGLRCVACQKGSGVASNEINNLQAYCEWFWRPAKQVSKICCSLHAVCNWVGLARCCWAVGTSGRGPHGPQRQHGRPARGGHHAAARGVGIGRSQARQSRTGLLP